MRQLSENDLTPTFDAIGSLPVRARELLEARGITFAEEVHDAVPGPQQWALIALDDGTQFLLHDHYTRSHPQRVVVRGQVGVVTPAELCARLADALGLDPSDYGWVLPDWSNPR